ncbi:preprotein translocase subunit Sec61beta [Metabacillus malikii]|uniref:Preprotein translocase subunit Sec61beta n=1 Tax=Metabacillus malikii TaxID=1504265 RepID=A0ABT9ZNL7_9BACI|nr:preprotein translocase subunit Sec61beta [Metabacillus malikii]
MKKLYEGFKQNHNGLLKYFEERIKAVNESRKWKVIVVSFKMKQ